MTRISGIASGIDTEALVKDLMASYKTKIDNTEKKKLVLQYKQEAYQSVTSDLRNFYDKYFTTTSKDSMIMSSTWNNTAFTSSNTSAVGVSGSSNAVLGTYSVEVSQLASTASTKLTESDLAGLTSLTINNGKEDVKVDLTSAYTDGNLDMSKLSTAINSQLSSKGISAQYSSISGGLIIQTKTTGESQQLQVKYENGAGTFDTGVINGQDCKYTISDGVNPPYKGTSSKNTASVDGINLTFKQVTNGNPVTITGENNVDAVKEKIVNFINDYNELISKLNTLVGEKYDSNYLPLTDSEKEAMSESQIELWEKKAKTGLLSGDSDLKRIIRNLKQTMTTVLGTNLNKIGIESVDSYGDSKNGTYTINEDKLTKALQENFDDIKTLFLDGTGTDSKGVKNSILETMKSTLYSECQSTSAALIKKAGLENNASLSSTLKAQIAKYDEKLNSLNTWFTKKETALYKKFAHMESSLALINNKYSSISSLFMY